MKLFLMGASGMIGSRILAEAVARGHEVTAGARNPDRIADLPGVHRIAVEAEDASTLADHAAKADVYVSAVSPRSTGDAEAEGRRLGDALIEAAEKAGRRVVLVGGAGSLSLPDGTPVMKHLPDFILPEALGMKATLDRLKDTDLDWTFFAPAASIAPGERTGSFRLGGDTLVADPAGESRISAEDYAVALVDEVESGKNRRKVMTAAY